MAYINQQAKDQPQLSAQELNLRAQAKYHNIAVSRNTVRKAISRARQDRYPPAPKRDNLAGTDFSKTMFADFHVFSKKLANGETVIVLALKSAYRQIADAEGLITDGTFKTRACFGQLFIIHGTVGPKLQEDHDHEHYEDELRKNFTRPLAYAFMETRSTASYELLWESLKEEINDELKTIWNGPKWMMSDFEYAQIKAVKKVRILKAFN